MKKKEKEQVKSKNWKCEKCETEYSNPIACTAVLCIKCTRTSRGRYKWMSPAD